jgi:ABC-type nickel/cobalt efflux system permease component RcnA
MTDKIRGTIAILVGIFALYQAYVLYQKNPQDWHMWLEAAAGLLLICLGTWRLQRKAVDPTDALLK